MLNIAAPWRHCPSVTSPRWLKWGGKKYEEVHVINVHQQLGK